MATEGAGNGHGPVEDQLAELKALLLGPERDQIGALEKRLSEAGRADELSRILAEAVKLASGRDNKLRKSLQTTIEESLGISVRKNPRQLADALFPIFGKAVRRAIASELEGMMQSLGQMLEQSVSWRSLQWRWEAMRTRKPYAEVVLLRSLLYKVEQVFLIHRKTGILLQHAAAGGAAVKDPEMVSGMLTAIQDFVRDSVGGAEEEDLETVRVGQHTVVLAYGPHTILAGFVKGIAPRTLSRVFQDANETIHEMAQSELVKFQGDTSKFDACQPVLQACLLGRGDPGRPPAASWGAQAVVLGIPLLLAAGLGWWWWTAAQAERRWRDFVWRLSGEPGIVVTAAERRGGGWFMKGLRDPLAVDPNPLLDSAGVRRQDVTFRWEPYHSLDERLAVRRLYTDLKFQLERRTFRFKPGSAEVPPEQRFLIEDAAELVLRLVSAAAAINLPVRVEVRGNHDPSGSELTNLTLARERAENVRAALATAGVQSALLAARGRSAADAACAATTDEARLLCRTAAFKVLEGAR